MKKTLLISGIFIALSTSPAAALEFKVYNASTQTGEIENWISDLGGQVRVLEDFENQTAGWYPSLGTGVGTFEAAGMPGVGETSYLRNSGSFEDGAHFSIQDRDESWYGRKNTTVGETARKWLDSGDISELTLTLNDSSLTNLFFYLQDPSDVGATTTVNANAYGEEGVIYDDYVFSDKDDPSSFFVGITLDPTETLLQLSWSTGDSNGDGYGLDDFSTVAPVPEPATMLLFGTGLAGFASLRRRKKK